MAFNDGDPIDAAKLAELETQINTLKSTIPTVGGSSTTITVGGTTGQVATPSTTASSSKILGARLPECIKSETAERWRSSKYCGKPEMSLQKKLILLQDEFSMMKH